MKILILGGCGFVFSNFIRYLQKERPDWIIVNFDSLTYAGNLENLKGIKNDKYYFVKGDIRFTEDLLKIESKTSIKDFDYIIIAAAESHVDRSLIEPGAFIDTNIWGTTNVLNFFKGTKVKKFIYIGSDEEFGSLKKGEAKETDKLNPSSPYSVAKAAGSMMCEVYHKSFGINYNIVRMSNNYGSYQYPEKVIPLFISKLSKGEKVPLYGEGKNEREWLYVEDACKGILKVIEIGKLNEIYNLGGGKRNRISNYNLTKRLLELFKLNDKYIEKVKDRPGHDLRYALDSSKAKEELGWTPEINIDSGLELCRYWYKTNQDWVNNIINKSEYKEFMKRQYGKKN